MSEFKLADEKVIDEYLKTVKVGDEASTLSLSKDKIKIDGKVVDSTNFENIKVDHAITSDNDLNIESDGDITLDACGQDILFAEDGEKIALIKNAASANPSLTLYGQNGDTADYFNILCTTNGATTLTTVDDAGADANMEITPDGDLTLDPNGDLLITPNTDVNINLASGGEFVLQENSGTYTPTADTHVSTKKYVDDNAGGTDTAYATYSAMNWRMASVNNYYAGNQSLGTSVTAGDFGVGELKYAIFNSIQTVTLTRCRIVYYVTSTEPYEFELWDVTVPSDGSTAASTAVKIGDTLETSGDVSANRYYAITSGGLSYSLSASHQVFLLCRYTDGSSTKQVNASVSLEMTI